jgi:hypothetical protein
LEMFGKNNKNRRQLNQCEKKDMWFRGGFGGDNLQNIFVSFS